MNRNLYSMTMFRLFSLTRRLRTRGQGLIPEGLCRTGKWGVRVLIELSI